MTNVHARTPNVVAVDGRGLPVRQVAYLRSEASVAAVALIAHQQFDGAGRLAEQWDARLFGHAPKANQSTIYNLMGEPLRIDSVDAGWRLILPGLASETLERWDARGNRWRMHHDSQLRPVALDENSDLNVETFTYGDATQDAGRNVRGQLLEQVDPSGTLRCDSYGLSGLPLRQARAFADADIHTTEQTFDALGALIGQTDAGGHRQHLRLDVAGQLKAVDLQLKFDTASQPIMLEAQYNAAGQIERQEAANGIISRWTYDPADGRLSTLQAGKPGADLRQDLAYFYDRVGNITRIEDHAVATVHFANQRVDGHREFTYDSLYRLITASGFEGDTPHLQPGLPAPIIPIDPNRRFNYAQQYEYDSGNNLTRLRHIREGNNHTHITRIDPNSNRGVRWTEGDPEPDFDTQFDTHGNQLFLQSGTPALTWNSRDQLSTVTVIKREDDLSDDNETYLYSQGERVGKTHTAARAVRQTRYLPGIEIRTSSDGERLHVLTLGLAHGSVRCLHWEAGQPVGIEADQLRYNLDDHLGSSTLELDRAGGLISLEHYYPFGGTAWYAGRSALEASYRTVRYSGKEMDASGLYYYGARYYAPWLARWVSADPAGDIDGLNLYGFVTNNPMTYVDVGGFIREKRTERDDRKAAARKRQQQYRARSELREGIYRFSDLLGTISARAIQAQAQLDNHRSASTRAQSAASRVGVQVAKNAINLTVGAGLGVGGAALGAVAGPPGMIIGVAVGFAVAKGVSLGLDKGIEKAGVDASVKFKSSALEPSEIIKGVDAKKSPATYLLKKAEGFAESLQSPSRKDALNLAREAVNTGTSTALKAADVAGGSAISAVVKTATGTVEIAHEIIGAGQEISEEKIDRADQYINELITLLTQEITVVDRLYDKAGVETFDVYVPLSKIFGQSNGITRRSMHREMEATVGRLKQTQRMLR
jgi:insecticidal toxin complex protein TccC